MKLLRTALECGAMISLMAPQRLPGRLHAAFHAVGLEWPDLPLERHGPSLAPRGRLVP